ncbi:MAG: putative DNA polymerase III subunit epsilon [Promethearchaeota archaeon]|nr:MAG: putative DNA polymerase III subunit epsilon [Candidatus Lokiarchaeota archaeon]
MNEIIRNLSNKITKPVTVFDLETTDVDHNTCDIVQFYGCRVSKDKDPLEISFICKPRIPIENGAAEVHGITNEIADTYSGIQTHIKRVYELFANADVAGYNIKRFDLPVMDRILREFGFHDTFKDSYIYDAYPIYLTHSPRNLSESYKYYLQKELKDAHDASADSLATIEIINAQLDKENKNLIDLSDNPNDRVGFSDHIIIEGGNHIINFGKYKGTLVKDVDKGFLKWVLNKDFPEPVKSVIKRYV